MRLPTLLCALLLCAIPVTLRAQETEKRSAMPQPGSEKIAPDVSAEAIWDGRKIVPFKAIDNPPMVAADKAGDFLGDDEYVLGVVVNGEARAYPTRLAWWHHIINDEAGKPDKGGRTPFAVTYCSVCNTGIRFDPKVEGKPIKLDFYGLYNGVVILCERETGSVLLQVEGRFVKGPLTGKGLKMKPLLDTTWGQWKLLHPDTLVMTPDNDFKKFYRPKGQAEPRGYDRFPLPFFEKSLTRKDTRLPAFDKVLGVTLIRTDTVGKETALRRAYPVKSLREAGGALNDTLDGDPVAVLFDAGTEAAHAVSRNIEGKTLTFEVRKLDDGASGFFDKETGTRWSLEGVGMEGPLTGKTLTPLENHLSQWYGWAAYFPATTIYGQKEKGEGK